MSKSSFLIVISFLLVNIKSQAQSEEISALLTKKREALQLNDASAMSSFFHSKSDVKKYPNERIAKGQEQIEAYYTAFFQASKIIKVSLLDRMVFKGVVIDKELVETEKASTERVVFYKFKKNKIKMMMILEKTNAMSDPIRIVEQQLQAYNQRDIGAFVRTYASNAKVYYFGSSVMFGSKGSIKNHYSDLFKFNTALNCSIKQRMTMGNVVIDSEVISTNGPNIKAIAIYEVDNGLISTVSLLQ